MPTDTVFAQSEVISKLLPIFFGDPKKCTVPLNFVKKNGNVEKIGERDFRAPFLTQNGGRFGTFNSDGGALGNGTKHKGDKFVQTAFAMRLNYEMTTLAVDANKDSNISRVNSLKKAIQNAPLEAAKYADSMWHNDGTGKLATATAVGTWSGATKQVYTMNTTQACRLLTRGQYVQPYSAANAVLGSPLFIELIDYANRLVYLSGLTGGAGASATDYLAIDGASGSPPTGPNGLKYFNSDATSGTTLGVTRSTEPEVISNSADAANGPLTFMKGQELIDKIIERRKGLNGPYKWLSSEKQVSNLRSQVLNMAHFELSGSKDLNTDLNPGANAMTFKFCGIPGYVDPHQDNDRMDLLNFDNWSRVQIKDIGFYEIDGQRFFTIYDSSTGAPKAAQWFSLYWLENYVSHNPGEDGYIKQCGLPTY
jgi:hypothetical protein